jgi:hypothetical protein
LPQIGTTREMPAEFYTSGPICIKNAEDFGPRHRISLVRQGP